VDDSEDPRAIRAKEAQSAVATAVRVPDLPLGWSAFKHKESGARDKPMASRAMTLLGGGGEEGRGWLQCRVSVLPLNVRAICRLVHASFTTVHRPSRACCRPCVLLQP
jgi:hypothetical protein